MTIIRTLSTVVIFTGVTVGVAAPSSADPDIFEGTYTYNGAGVIRTWNATSCGIGCSHVDAPGVPDSAGFSGDAKLGYGGWALTLLSMPDTVVCSDGTTAQGNITYRWSGGSLSGQASTWTTVAACGEPPKAYQSFPFSLTKVS